MSFSIISSLFLFLSNYIFCFFGIKYLKIEGKLVSFKTQHPVGVCILTVPPSIQQFLCHCVIVSGIYDFHIFPRLTQMREPHNFLPQPSVILPTLQWTSALRLCVLSVSACGTVIDCRPEQVYTAFLLKKVGLGSTDPCALNQTEGNIDKRIDGVQKYSNRILRTDYQRQRTMLAC